MVGLLRKDGLSGLSRSPDADSFRRGMHTFSAAEQLYRDKGDQQWPLAAISSTRFLS